MKNKKAFTLIEFLIALVVIGFIVGLLINYFSNPLRDASISSVASRIEQEATAAVNASNLYYNKHGEFPNTFNDLVTDGLLEKDPATGSFSGDLSSSGWFNSASEVSLGDGTKKLMVIFSMNGSETEKKVCQKINADMSGFAPDAAVPELTTNGNAGDWASRPPESAKSVNMCFHTNMGGGYLYYRPVL